MICLSLLSPLFHSIAHQIFTLLKKKKQNKTKKYQPPPQKKHQQIKTWRRHRQRQFFQPTKSSEQKGQEWRKTMWSLLGSRSFFEFFPLCKIFLLHSVRTLWDRKYLHSKVSSFPISRSFAEHLQNSVTFFFGLKKYASKDVFFLFSVL